MAPEDVISRRYVASHDRPRWDPEADPDVEQHPDVKECYARAAAALAEAGLDEERDEHLFLAAWSLFTASAVYDDDTETSFSFEMSVHDAIKRGRHDIRVGNSILWNPADPLAVRRKAADADARDARTLHRRWFSRPVPRARASRARRAIRTSRGSPARPRQDDPDQPPLGRRLLGGAR